MRHIPWALALLLVTAQATAAPNPPAPAAAEARKASPTLTLEEALSLALKNYPGLSADARVVLGAMGYARRRSLSPCESKCFHFSLPA